MENINLSFITQHETEPVKPEYYIVERLMFYFHGTVNCCIWVIKLRILHRMKLMAVIMMTRQCHVVWVKIILRDLLL